MRRGKVVLSKVRGDINPADVLTKPKSLEDMRSLLNFSCIDWCDSSRPQILFIVAIESNMRVIVFLKIAESNLLIMLSEGIAWNHGSSRIVVVEITEL